MVSKMFALEEQPYSADDAKWDAFVMAHPHGSILQTTNWARLKNRFGWSSQRVWMRRDGRLVGGAQVLFRSIGMGVVKLGYVPHGPLIDWRDGEQVDVLFNHIDQAAYGRGAGLVKVEPRLWQQDFSPDAWDAICHQHDLTTHTDTIQPPATILIDLRASEDEILARMKSKTRYNIRLATRKGVTTRQGTAADMPAFVRLMRATAERDGFAVHDPMYYGAAYEIFIPQYATLIVAEYEGKPLAMAMIFLVNQTTAAYFYGASGNEERQRMPNYAVQWAAIRWARSRGSTTYDMWGIPDASLETLEAEFTERKDGLWPVYRFKRGFGGQIYRTVGAADRVYNQLLHRLYRWRRGI